MINALGLLEVDGMVAAVDAADAMLKAANVRLLSHEVLDPGRLTLVVEGDLAACRAALDAGSAAAAPRFAMNCATAIKSSKSRP